MANEEHLSILKQGVETWNKWREEKRDIRPDLRKAILSRASLRKAILSGADLEGSALRNTDLRDADLSGAVLSLADLSGAVLSLADLSGADLRDADLRRASLSYADLSMDTNLSGAILIGAYLGNANLRGADLRDANLSGANLSSANLNFVNLRGANLSGAILSGASLEWANLSGAILSGADLQSCDLVGTNLENATLTGCKIYGVNCWDVKLSGAEQSGLIISKHNEPIITVDGLEVAQFIYLMLNNEKIRDVINTIGKKAVLILGRFNLPERKAVLNALREKLTRLGFLPIVFDFERPTDRDFTETIKTLAGMCRFIIADITNPKSTPLELQALVPDYMIPFAPIIQKGYDEQGRQEKPFAMLADLQNKYRWILDVIEYDTQEKLIANLEKAIIEPAIKKHNELIETKAQRMPVKSIDEFANQDNGL